MRRDATAGSSFSKCILNLCLVITESDMGPSDCSRVVSGFYIVPLTAVYLLLHS